MMNPKALEALKQARELFRQPSEVAKDDIPEEVTQVFSEPLRKPRVVLLPPNAPKFDQHSMKEEHKKMEQVQKQTDTYVEMSVKQAIKACLAKGITKPASIIKETGKPAKQIYTQLWLIKEAAKKAKAKAQRPSKSPTPLQQAKEWDNEGTPFEDAHYVVLKSREDYEQEIDRICEERNKLETENAELRAVIKYLERKVMVS